MIGMMESQVELPSRDLNRKLSCTFTDDTHSRAKLFKTTGNSKILEGLGTHVACRLSSDFLDFNLLKLNTAEKGVLTDPEFLLIIISNAFQ